MSEQIIAAVVAAAVSAIVALMIAIIQMRQSKATHMSEIGHDINEKYNKMIDYRLAHPEVLALAKDWRPDCWEAIYNQQTDADRAWAVYYGYVELLIFYCSCVLYARSAGLLAQELYDAEHEPLIKLLLTEHCPIMTEITDEKYVSRNLVAYIKEQPELGWDWANEYKQYYYPEAKLNVLV